MVFSYFHTGMVGEKQTHGVREEDGHGFAEVQPVVALLIDHRALARRL